MRFRAGPFVLCKNSRKSGSPQTAAGYPNQYTSKPSQTQAPAPFGNYPKARKGRGGGGGGGESGSRTRANDPPV